MHLHVCLRLVRSHVMCALAAAVAVLCLHFATKDIT